ncbi:MAG: prephenate dehydratase [Candidatus Micrarchaeota archaeon]
MNDEKMRNIEKMRKKVELIDYEILKLINERMEFAVKLKKLKTTIADPKREEEVINYVCNRSHNILSPSFSKTLIMQIIEESKRLQAKDMKLIGFQGEHGAYSELAARSYNNSLVPIPCAEFAEIFESIEKGILDYGIVPVENSLEGSVVQVNDLFIETDLKIIGEINMPIHHNLLALPETNYRDIKSVYSHSQALAQCHQFISRNNLEPRPFYDTAGAAKMLSKERLPDTAVIASSLCAQLYNLEVIKENIEDHASNSTRFVIISREESAENGNKCSILFSTKHEAGALFRILKIFSDARVNLTRIESRRIRGDQRNYAFLLDFQGCKDNKKIEDALNEVKKDAIMYKFMGCYKEACE